MELRGNLVGHLYEDYITWLLMLIKVVASWNISLIILME